MNTTQQGVIVLLKSAVTGQKLEIPEDFSLEDAYEIMRKQALLPLAYQGAVNCGIPQEQPVMQRLLRAYYQHLIRSERQMRAVNRILQAFEENEVDYMPLKGCNMKLLYPKPELRVMGDADILIRMEQYDRIQPIMEALGFRLKNENEHVFNWLSDDLYVELHKSVVPPEDNDYYAYYRTGWHLGLKQKGSRYDLSAEDTFIFLFTHFARHYRIAGIGCRHVMDLYVYRRAFPEMNEGYIREELKKLRLLDFYENMLRLIAAWFDSTEPDEITDLITAFIFSGGNWGTVEAGIYAQEVKSARKQGYVKRSGLKAAFRAIFPSRGFLTYRYPVLLKAPYLQPVIWIVRWIDILFFRPQKIKKKVKILRSVDDDAILSYQQALTLVGLDFHFDNE